jgi:hypothetical protein
MVRKYAINECYNDKVKYKVGCGCQPQASEKQNEDPVQEQMVQNDSADLHDDDNDPTEVVEESINQNEYEQDLITNGAVVQVQHDQVQGQQGQVEGQKNTVEMQHDQVQEQHGQVQGQKNTVQVQQGQVEGKRKRITFHDNDDNSDSDSGTDYLRLIFERENKKKAEKEERSQKQQRKQNRIEKKKSKESGAATGTGAAAGTGAATGTNAATGTGAAAGTGAATGTGATVNERNLSTNIKIAICLY